MVKCNLPKLLAFSFNCSGVFLFRQPNKYAVHKYSRTLPCCIFALTVFIYLIDVALFKSKFTRLPLLFQFVLEFIVSLFIIECMVMDFWFPLENFTISQLIHGCDSLETCKCSSDISVVICQPLIKNEDAVRFAVACSYGLSLFFLYSVLEGTGVIDRSSKRYQNLKCAMKTLFGKFMDGLTNLFPYQGMGRRRRSSPSTSSSPCPKRQQMHDKYYCNYKHKYNRYDYI